MGHDDGIRPVILDITSQAGIDRVHQQVMVETGGYGLDVLVNVARILVLGPVEAVSGQQTRAQRPARPAAASFAAAGHGVAVKYEGWGFDATDKLVPEQRRQQDDRAERISGGD